MVFQNHIAWRFLTDTKLHMEMCEYTYPEQYKKLMTMKVNDDIKTHLTPETEAFFHLVSNSGNKSYYVTETVIRQFDLLKVYKSGAHYDWSVFKHLKFQKVTLILPKDNLLRVVVGNNKEGKKSIELFWLHFKKDPNPGGNIEGKMGWVMNYFNAETGELCPHFEHHDTVEIEEFMYKLMIFFYLTDNVEEILPPRSVTGTKKTGKIKNDFPFSVVKVTSKWNVTSIRTEGFMVSGHWRLQPYKDHTKNIWIDPFAKSGYKRTADKPKHI